MNNFLTKDTKQVYLIFKYMHDFIFFYKNLKYIYFGYFFFKYNVSYRFPINLIFDLFKISFKKYNIFGFLFINKSYITRLKNLNFLMLNYSVSNYFSLIEVFGRNYRFILKNDYLIIFLGFCHYFYIKIPKKLNINLLNDQGTSIVLWSFYKPYVMRFSFLLKKLYKKDIYKGKGLIFNSLNLKLKRKKKKEFL